MNGSLLELAGRFAVMLAVLGALGAAPATFLPAALGGRVRAGLAPVLGLCTGVCGFTTIEWFVPAGRLGAVLAAACAASLALALWRTRRAKGAGRPSPSAGAAALAAAEMLLVVAATFVPVATALSAHHSVGPMSYEVFDGPGYVANAQAATTVSIHAAAHTVPGNEVVRWWSADVASGNRLDYAPLVAVVDALAHLDATQTYAADLLAVLAAGGLGLYAAVASATPRRARPSAVLAGMGFGGAFFLQLVFDGSQAALTGLSVLVPLCVLLSIAARAPKPATLGVVALLVAGLATLYPIFLFPVALAAAIAGAGALARSRQVGDLSARSLARWAARVAAVAVGAGLLDVVATVRDARSLSSIATGGGILASFPAYHLGAGVLPSWLLQTRDLYGVAFGAQSPLVDLVPALLVPVAVVAASAAGLRRNPAVVLPALLLVVSLGLGAYEAIANGCGYCEDRSLLSAVPPLLFLVFVGLAGAFSTGWALRRAALVAVTAAYVGFAAYDTANARSRYSAGSVYVTAAERALVARLPPGSGPVELEGFGAAPSSMAAEPYLYELVLAAGHEVSVATAEEGTGLARDWGPKPLRPPYFRGNYRYVLSRLPGVRTDRQVIASDGTVALERRRGPDLTVEAGLSLPSAAAATPEVTGPLVLVATGGKGPESARLRLATSSAGGLAGLHLARARRHGPNLEVCVPLGGTPALRTATVRLPASAGLRLESMALRSGRC